MAKAAQQQVASLNPDDFIQGGLADDFRGKITEAVYAKWDYEGNIDHDVLAVKLTIEREDGEKPVVQFWSAGDLTNFVPSQDGEEEAEEGPFALRVGKKTALTNSTNFAHLLEAILDAGTASKKFTKANLTTSLACLETLDAQWNRIPQKKRAGLVPTEGAGANRGKDILVVTEVFGYGAAEKAGKGKAAAGGPAKAAKGKPAKDESEDAGETLDSRLSDALVEIISAAGGTIKKSKLAPLVLRAFATDKDKSKAIGRCTQADFLSGDDVLWTYDEEEGTLSI
jgi:hypothetical protein